MWDQADDVNPPGSFSVLWCGGHTEVVRYFGYARKLSDRPWVTLNLCVMIMRRYCLGEGGLVSTITLVVS